MYVIVMVGGDRAAVFHTLPAAAGHPNFLLPDYIFDVQIPTVGDRPIGDGIPQGGPLP